MALNVVCQVGMVARRGGTTVYRCVASYLGCAGAGASIIVLMGAGGFAALATARLARWRHDLSCIGMPIFPTCYRLYISLPAQVGADGVRSLEAHRGRCDAI
jgi:hypothetical protein